MRITPGRPAVILLLAGLGFSFAREATLIVRLEAGPTVRAFLITENIPAVRRVELYRSTSRLDGAADTTKFPITVYKFPRRQRDCGLVDSMVADNVLYYYRAKFTLADGTQEWSNVDSVRIPDRRLQPARGLRLVVDKVHYILEVWDQGGLKKRYPLALGRNPFSRKLHEDNATTPEGMYKIVDIQPYTSTRRAFDLNYPNEVDSCRYVLAAAGGRLPLRRGRLCGIGGEIQIHGKGIDSNWTNGCIALRNRDVDELFRHPAMRKGIPVTIVGRELSRADIYAAQSCSTKEKLLNIQQQLKNLGFLPGALKSSPDRELRLALGRFQEASGLAVTCELDRHTVSLLTVHTKQPQDWYSEFSTKLNEVRCGKKKPVLVNGIGCRHE